MRCLLRLDFNGKPQKNHFQGQLPNFIPATIPIWNIEVRQPVLRGRFIEDFFMPKMSRFGMVTRLVIAIQKNVIFLVFVKVGGEVTPLSYSDQMAREIYEFYRMNK